MKNLQCALALACGFLLAMVALGTPLQAGINRDRARPHNPAPPTPPGIRITYQGGSAG